MNIKLFIRWVFGSICFLMGIFGLKNSVVGGMFLLISAFFLIPPLWGVFTKKRLDSGYRIAIITILGFWGFVLIVPSGSSVEKTDIEKRAFLQQKKFDSTEVKLKQEAEIREKQRQDSLKKYVALADGKYHKKNYSDALLLLRNAIPYAGMGVDSIVQKQADYNYQARNYKESIKLYSTLIDNRFSESDNYYQRALCLDKIKKRQEAVNDLRQAMSLGNLEAEKLYNKINPIKKRVSYYVTRCCDGTTSSSKGRGTCSHHGGVCNWNEPIYEEYRKY
ncbi:MAG: DUF3761 domain-containing protein [Aequorivita sp.]|nr:DUF3761 domain-containing protein [Aequorivita sp.]